MRTRTGVAVGLLAAGLLFASSRASAEDVEQDCGPNMSLQNRAGWGTGGGCATNLRQSRGLGRERVLEVPTYDESNSWLQNIGANPRDVVIANNGDLFFGAGTKFFRYSKTGGKYWELELGQNVGDAAAIGADGTLYVGAGNGRVFAVSQQGQLKWTFTSATLGHVSSSITLGLGGRIYAGGTNGYVVALNPNGSQAWMRQVSGMVTGDMTMTHDGEILYVATTAGKIHAINTESATELWNGAVTAPASVVTAMVVNRWGTVLAGTANGSLMAFTPRGVPLATRAGFGNSIRSMALDRRGVLYILAASGSPGTETTRLYAVYQNAAFSEVPGYGAWTNGPSTNYSIVVDGNDTVWGNFRSSAIVGIGTHGIETYSYATNYLGAIPGLAMSNDGTLVFSSGPNVISHGPGFGTRNGRNYVVEPRVVQYAPGSDGSVVRECTTTSGWRRPGINLEFNSSGVVTKHELNGATDPGCPLSFCRDDESPFGNWGLAWTMLMSTEPKNPVLFPGTVTDPAGIPLLPIDYKDPSCEAVEPAKGCQAVNPNGMRWNAACATNRDCGATEVCAAVCPRNAANNQPLASCDQSQVLQYCADIDEKRCESLPAELPAPPSYTTATCHELRECAQDRDRVSEAEATPSCFTPNANPPDQGPSSGGSSCDTALTLTAPVFNANTASFLPNTTWNRAEPPCSLWQPESMAKNDTGGKGANSARNNKDWGLWMGADANLDFNLKPLPFGFVNPKASGKANFDVLAKVMGKQIVVFEVDGTADLDRCKAMAKVTTKLFNQTIQALQFSEGYDESGTDSACNNFFANVDYMAGTAKAALMRANRMHAYVTEAASSGYPAIITKGMCQSVFGSGEQIPECNGTYSPTKAATVVNRTIENYRTYVRRLNDGSANAGLVGALQAHLQNVSNKVAVNTGTGEFSYAKDLVGFGQPFNILGATAEFPIGPVILTLEVNGGGEWGLNGGLSMSAKFLPPSPNARAYVVANPFAHVDVDVYLGVGFGIPGLKINAGFGGLLTLVDIKTPLRGGSTISAQPQAHAYPSRAWPAAFSRFQNGPLLRAPSQVKWDSGGELNAAATLSVLNGSLDARVRLKMLFAFNKTWKRKITEWKGKSWDYDWAGSHDTPLVAPPGTGPVLDSIPFPDIPNVSSALFDGNGGIWAQTSALPHALARDHADIAEKTPGYCGPTILN